MGKQKKRKRDHNSNSDYSRSRSRSKDRRRRLSDEEDIVRQQSSYFKSLSCYKHQYYLSNESKTIGSPYVVWNLCVRLAPRPSLIFIICQSMSHLATIQKACRLLRNVKTIDETSFSKSISELVKQKAEVIITTQKKCSIIVALEEDKRVFDVILNVSHCFDSDFYVRVSDLAKDGATMVTFSESSSSIKQLSEAVGAEFSQCQSNITQAELQRELISDVQMAPEPSFQTKNMLRNLGVSFEEAAGRLLQLQRRRRQPAKSLHLNMAGYITYKLNMDVEFNSLKYVWNFLREQFPKSLYQQIRGMQKYQNEKGVVLNIPEELRFVAETVSEKLKRHKSRFKGIELQQCAILPPLQDIDSEEYKLMKEKKRYAMDNKNELEIFIGGVPYEMDENSIRKFFKEKGVNLFLVRLLKDQKGFSKGIGFGLCQNREHYLKAIELNGSRLMDRTIRVKLADQRKD